MGKTTTLNIPIRPIVSIENAVGFLALAVPISLEYIT